MHVRSSIFGFGCSGFCYYYYSSYSSSSYSDFSSSSLLYFSPYFYSPSPSSYSSPSSSSESTDSYYYYSFYCFTIFYTSLTSIFTLFIVCNNEITEPFNRRIIRLNFQYLINICVLFLPSIRAYSYFLSRTSNKKS